MLKNLRFREMALQVLGAIVVVGFILAFSLLWLARSRPRHRTPNRFDRAPTPYRKRNYLFSLAERAFYEVLEHAAGSDFRVFAKVRLSDLVWMPSGTRNRRFHWYRIAQKHVDFVLCDPRRLGPVLVIELDDSSHRRFDRQERDEFIDTLMESIGLPIWRVPVRRRYALPEVAREIRERASVAADFHPAGGSTTKDVRALPEGCSRPAASVAAHTASGGGEPRPS